MSIGFPDLGPRIAQQVAHEAPPGILGLWLQDREGSEEAAKLGGFVQRTKVQSPGAPVPLDDVNTLGEVCADAALSFEPIMRVASGQFRLPIPNSLASYWSLVARVQGFFIRERVAGISLLSRARVRSFPRNSESSVFSGWRWAS